MQQQQQRQQITFDDIYLGAKASDPTLDNDGDALTEGDMYFNTGTDRLKVYSGSAWADVAIDSATVVTKTSATGSGRIYQQVQQHREMVHQVQVILDLIPQTPQCRNI